MFEPYSQERNGELLDYLLEHEGSMAENVFFGSRHFFLIKDLGLMLPLVTSVRVNQSPVPDRLYFVNHTYWLESHGPDEHNMSCIGGEKGSYNPDELLKCMLWSIYDLNLYDVNLPPKPSETE